MRKLANPKHTTFYEAETFQTVKIMKRQKGRELERHSKVRATGVSSLDRGVETGTLVTVQFKYALHIR